MDLRHKELLSYSEVNMYAKEYFEASFWEDFDFEEIYKSYIETGCKFILFERKSIPYALMVYKTHGENVNLLLENTHEILLFEVSDRTCGKRMGVGEHVIRYFKNIIAPDKDICGYSISDAAPFWFAVSTEVDEEVYDYLKDDDFNGDATMYFRIKQ